MSASLLRPRDRSGNARRGREGRCERVGGGLLPPLSRVVAQLGWKVPAEGQWNMDTGQHDVHVARKRIGTRTALVFSYAQYPLRTSCKRRL